jgi:hypothetical protein
MDLLIKYNLAITTNNNIKRYFNSLQVSFILNNKEC